MFLSLECKKVELDGTRAESLRNEDGLISKEDFTQFAKDTHLLEVDSFLGDSTFLLSPKKSRKHHTPKKDANKATAADEQRNDSVRNDSTGK